MKGILVPTPFGRAILNDRSNLSQAALQNIIQKEHFNEVSHPVNQRTF